MQDIIIIGSGPAGLSAAITARMRNAEVCIVSNNRSGSGLYKAKEIGNYPGLPGISGAELSSKLTAHAIGMGAELISARVTSVMPMGKQVSVTYGSEVLSAKALIITTGISQKEVFPGEEALLGHGVSYCATCDGMLYRGKRVCVVCHSADADDEADFLESIGCDVVRVRSRKIEVNGTDRVTGIVVDGEEIECEGVFILRDTIAPTALLPGLETDGGHIKVDRLMCTSLPGVFAAGDCVGGPYQVSKATGEGQVAVLSALQYIKENA